MTLSERLGTSALCLLGLLVAPWVVTPAAASDAGIEALSSETVEARILDALASGADATPLIETLDAGRPKTARRPVSTAADGLEQALSNFRTVAMGALDKAADRPSGLAKLEDVTRAHERLRAADLLVRARFEGIAARLDEAGVGGEISGRLLAAETAYLELVDPILRRLDEPLAALRQQDEVGDETELDHAEKQRGVLAALAEVLPQLAPSAEPAASILRSRLLPFRRGELPPRPPALTPALTPAYLDASDPAPEAADYAGTPDAPLAEEILQQAEALGYDYVQIYEFVRNEIELEHYAGAMQGAVGTLRSGRGNDVDQASLLIALLRASGAAARYVHGVIRVSAEQAGEALGLSDVGSVTTALTRAGIAVEPVTFGYRNVHLEYTWVEAYLPYTNYRGAVVDFTGRSWVPLAPAFHATLRTPPSAVLAQMEFDASAFLDGYLAGPQSLDPLATLRGDVELFLTENGGGSYQEQLGDSSLVAQHLGLVPSTLPMTVVAVTGESAELDAEHRHQVRIVARSGPSEIDSVLLDVTVALSEVAGRRMTLSYQPATVDDHRTVNFFGGLELVPAYLVELRPQLKIGGRSRAVGEPLSMAIPHRIEIELSGPWGSERVGQTVFSGTYLAVGLGAPRISRVAEEPEDPADTERLAARLLSQVALGFSERWDAAEDELAGLFDVALVRPLPSLVMAANAMNVETLAGLPEGLRWRGVTLDAALRVAEPVARAADGESGEADWMRLAALAGSALEHGVFESDFLVESVSADKGLGLAHQAGLEVLRIDAANLDTSLAQLAHPQAVLDDIVSWVESGRIVEVPRQPLTLHAWQGSVWRAEDPESGAGGYFLSGGLAGGQTAEEPEEWVLEFLADALAAPYLGDPNPDPFSAISIRKVPASDLQEGTAGEELERALTVFVSDRDGRPVAGAPVTFAVLSGGGTFAGDNPTTVLSALTSSLGIASARYLLGQSTGGQSVFVLREPTDEFQTRAGLNQVLARVESSLGPRVVESPFQLLAYPGEPAVLRRTDTEEVEFPDSLVALWSDTMILQVEDEYGNPIANADVELAAGEMDLDVYADICSNETAFGARNLEFFDATLDSSGQIAGCPSGLPVLGECGDDPLVLATGPEGWVAMGVIVGDTPLAGYVAEASVQDVEGLESLEFSYSVVVVGNVLRHCEPFRARQILTVGFDEGDTTRPGEELARRLTLRVLNNAETSCDPVFSDGDCVEMPCPPGEECSADPACIELCGGATQASPVCEEWCIDHPALCIREYVLDCTDTYAWHESQIVEDSASFSVTDGGSARPAQAVGPGTVETVLSAGPETGRYEASVEVASRDRQWLVDAEGVVDFGVLSHPGTGLPVLPPIEWRRELGGFWGIVPSITAVSPEELELTPGGLSRSEVDVDYAIDPADFSGAFVRLDLYSNDVWRANFVNASGASSGRISMFEGLPFDPEGFHEVEVVVSPGTTSEVRSEREPLTLAQRVLIDYGPRTASFGGDRSLQVREQLDLANERVCSSPTVLDFRLARAADVTLTFRRIDALEPDGTQQLGSEIFLIRDQRYDAGEHVIEITPTDLPAGDYVYELRTVDPFTGDEDIGRGTASSLRSENDSLPVGHTLIKGVDLWDGHLTLSRQDLAYAGRGVTLDFRRSYSSHSVEPGSIGIGWSHSYRSRISASSCGSLILSGGAGSGMRFVDDGEGGYRPLRGHHGTLIRNVEDQTFDFFAPAGTQYHYEPLGGDSWWLTRIEDPNGNTTALYYESGLVEPLLRQVVDASGRSLTFDYETRIFPLWRGQMLSSVSGPGGLSVSFGYDDRGHLIRASREGGARVETYGYEVQPGSTNELYGLLEEVTDVLDGGVTRYAYEPTVVGVFGGTTADRMALTTLVEPEGGTTIFSYDLEGLAARQESTTTTVTDRRGKVTTYDFDRYGSPIQITDPEDNVTTMTWAPDDVVMTSRRDANGTLTTLTYDEHGNLLTESVDVTDYDGVGHIYTQVNTYVPAPDGPPYIKTLLASRTDRNGHLTDLTYDERGNLRVQSIQVNDPVNGTTILRTEHVYGTNGDRLSTQDARGFTSHFTYDAYGHLETVRNPLGHVTRTEWNERSVPVLEVDPLGRETVIETDTLGRMVRRTLPDTFVERVIYDDASNTRTEIDAENRSTLTTFDLEGRVVRVDNAAGGSKIFGYDLEGNKTLESLWFDGSTPRADITFVYDDAGRLSRRTEPLGRVTDYAHDGVGNVTAETLSDADDAGFEPRITETDYDTMNRAITVRRRLEGNWLTSHMRYDGEGNKVLEVDALGRQTSHVYDALHRRLETVEPEGRVSRSSYDGNGNVIRTTLVNLPEDQVREMVYDAANRLVTRIDAEDHSRSIEYDDASNVLREIDARGHLVSHVYDDRNRRIRTTVHLEAGDSVTEMDYDGVGNLTEERHANSNVVTHIYDDLNRLKSTTDTLGAVAGFEYDARSNRTALISARGHRTDNVYDTLDRMVSQDLPEERSLTFTYDAAGNRLSETNARDFISDFEYDQVNRLVRTIDPLDHASSVTYDAVGNRLSETDRRDHTTDFEYDDLNRLVLRTDPPAEDGAPRYQMAYTYDNAGNRLTEVDRRGIVSEFSYDRENRRLETKRDGVRLETVTYDANGNVATSTDANENFTTFEYDERNLVTVERAPLEATTRFVYDTMGDRVEATDPEDRVVSWIYDLRRRMASETRGIEETTTFAYDLNGNRTRKTRPETGIWRWEYDDADRLAAVVDAESNRTEYTYDKNSNLETQTDGREKVTSFVHDELDRQSRVTYPDGAFETRGYDENGNLTERVDPKGQTTTFAHDVLNRETLRSLPPDPGTTDGLQSIGQVYDPNNNVLAVTEALVQSGDQVTTRTYDTFDRLQAVTDRWGHRLLYGYDANGNRTLLLDPDSNATSYTYDALNRLATVTAPDGGGLTSYTYFKNSRLETVTYPNGTSASHIYDGSNRVETIENRHNTVVVSSFGYDYDKNGNRIEQVETRYGEAAETTTYTYDLADRLRQVVYPDKTTDYTYDAAGNRETEQDSDAGGTLVVDKLYTYDDRNRLTEVTDAIDNSRDVTYGFDANGNQTSRTPATGAAVGFVFDVRDQLIRVEEDTLPIGSYRYDATGLRISKFTATGEARYVYDDRSVLVRSDDDGTTKFEYGPDRLLSVNHPTDGRAYYLFDALGSVVDLTTPGGSLLAQYQWDAWGNLRSSTDAAANPFGFTGHEMDGESGLIYARARFYDPMTGRFLSHDPAEDDLTNPPSLHKYLYAFSNPTVYVDPTGEIEVLKNFANFFRGGGVDNAAELAEGVQDEVSEVAGGTVGVVAGALTGLVSGVAGAAANAVAGAVDVVNTGVNVLVAGVAPDSALGQEAGTELNDTITSTVEGAKFVWENKREVGAALVDAVEETAEGVARGDAGAITRATATVVEFAVGGKAVSGAPKLLTKGRKATPKKCFVAGTLITTATGLRPIEEIEVDDLVLARSETTGELALRRVVELFVTPGQSVLELEIEASDGTTELLGTTSEHPFWVEDTGWVRASQLQPGDRLVSNTGGWLRVRQVRGSPRRETVYNFEVSEDHTYFVGESGIWVHNACPDDSKIPKQVIFEDLVQQRTKVTVIEGSKAREVVFEPKGRGSKFQDPESGQFIKKPESIEVEPKGALKTQTVDTTREFEATKHSKKVQEILERSAIATDFEEVLAEVLTELGKKAKKDK